uniref:Cystatin domain-containing protein n=1 Tax=Nothobranchius furzeri TaxID=105023 RepID=A0A8C6LGW7_NOTFU
MTTVIVFPLLFAALLAVGSCGMPGGLSDIDPNSPDFQEAMNFAVAEYNRHTNDFYYLKVIRVLSAQSQVVAGENIYMTLILARTPCRKTDPSSKHCPIHIHPHHAKSVSTAR